MELQKLYRCATYGLLNFLVGVEMELRRAARVTLIKPLVSKWNWNSCGSFPLLNLWYQK